MADKIETLCKVLAALIVFGWIVACFHDMCTWFARF